MTRHETFDHEAAELDIVDIWLIFARHWKLLAAAVLGGLLLGGAYAFLRSPSYQFLTLIEIGTQIVNDETQLIEAPESVEAKIRQGYITFAAREYAQAHSEEAFLYEVDASIPRDSQVIVLSSQGPVENQQALQDIHSNIVERLVRDHQQIIAVIRKGLQTELVKAETQLEATTERSSYLEAELQRLDQQHENKVLSIDQQIVLTQTELQRLEEENRNRLGMLDEQIGLRKIELARQDRAEALVDGQIQDLDKLLLGMQQNQADAVGEATDEAKAMTMLLIGNQIQQSRQQLAELRERRDVRIPNERSRLEKEIQDLERQKLIVTGELANKRDQFANQLDEARRSREIQISSMQAERERSVQNVAENERNQRLLQARTEELTIRMENLKQTNAPVVASQSLRPAGPGSLVILVLGTMLGGALGVMLVIVLQLAKLARERTVDVDATMESESKRPQQWPALGDRRDYPPLKKAAT